MSLSLSVTPSSFTFRRSSRVFVRFSNIFFLWICFTSGKVQPQETGYNFCSSPSINRLAATCNLFAYDHVHFLQRQESDSLKVNFLAPPTLMLEFMNISELVLAADF